MSSTWKKSLGCFAHGAPHVPTGRIEILAEDVALKTDAPAALAAAMRLAVPVTFTDSGNAYEWTERSDARITAAVWNTESGSSAADFGHGRANAESTDARDVMSVCAKSTDMAGPDCMSLRSVRRMSKMRMCVGGVPCARSCNTI